MLNWIDEKTAALQSVVPNGKYYTLTADENGTVVESTQTMWVGWEDAEKGWELRRPRLVYGAYAPQVWGTFQEPYLVIHVKQTSHCSS
jgi:hypothetical protein